MRQITSLLLVILVLSSAMLFSQHQTSLDKLKLELMNQNPAVDAEQGIPPATQQPGEVMDYNSFVTSDPSRAELWNNGPFITHPTGGAGGNAASAVQTNLQMSTYGFNANHAASPGNYYYFADDFTVTGTWNLQTITFYGYQTGSTTTSTFTGVYVRIWNGPPNAGGTVVWGDLTTNRLQSTNWSNVYRVLDTDLTNTQRPIMRIIADVSGCVLSAGTYWIQWGYTGSLTSGPWGPPITILGQTNTGNALQATTTGWTQLIDSGANAPQGLPFIIDGTAGSQPAKDVGVTTITAPNTGVNLTNNEPVKIKIKNFGTQAQSNIPWTVNWTGQGTGTLTGTHAGPLAPNEEVEITAGTANLSAYGTYNFQACTNLSGDENPANDCKTKSVTNNEPTLCVNNLYSTGCTYGDQLTSWNLANINVPNIPCSGTPPWYQNYMNLIHELQPGQTYVLTVTAGYSSTYFDVWIDWNNDLVLNNNEELILNDGICASANTPYTFNITIPSNAPAGLHVMRARTNWLNPVTDPCATYTYGNCVDFKVNIAGGGSQCPPPSNLQATVVNNNNVQLTWQAPQIPGTWLQWCSNTNNDGIGLTNGGTFIVAARWLPSDLTPYANKPITKVAIFPRSNANATFVLKIYKGTNASTTLLSQTLSGLTQNAWNEISINPPIQIDATKELWVGYQVTHGVGDYPVGVDAGPAVPNKGDMLSLDGGASWQALSSFGLDYNWNIKAFASDLAEGGISEPLVQYINDKFDFRGSQFSLGNLGKSPFSTFVERQCNPIGYKVFRNNEMIAQGITQLSYLDTGLAPGTYNYFVKATYTDGDSGPSNTATATITGQAGISFNPTSLTETHASSGLITTKTLNVTNTGTAPLNFTITVQTEPSEYSLRTQQLIEAGYQGETLPVGGDRANPANPGTVAPKSVKGEPNEPLRNLSEGFDDITLLPGLGWASQNNSQPAGTTSWFQGNATVFPAHQGPPTSYLGANYNNGAGVATISNWMMTPVLQIKNGDTWSFWTRCPSGSSWPDRLELRMSTAGNSTNVGTTATSVGDFTILLVSVNENLTQGGYPEVWTQFSGTISGLSGPVTGRLAFRYFVTNGGPNGANSNYIGIDTFVFQSSGGTTQWLSAAPTTGTINPGQTLPITVTFNSTGLANGTYNGALVFASNAPGSPHTVPATLTVGGAPPQPIFQVQPTQLVEYHLNPPQNTSKYLTISNPGTATLNWSLTIQTEPVAGPDAVVDPEYVAQQYAQRQANEATVLKLANGQPGGESPNAGKNTIIRYDNGTNNNGIGLTNGGTFYVSAYFPASTMGQYAGMKLNQVEVYIYQVPTTLQIRIYGQGTPTQPGPLLHQQAVSPIQQGWNLVTLSNQVDITGQDLWIGYAVTHTQGNYPAGVDAGPAVAGFGDMISLDNTSWVSMSIQYNLNYNWNIAGYLIPGTVYNKDVGIQSIVSPSTGVNLGNVPVVIKIKNFGSTAQSNIPWTVTWSGQGTGNLSGTHSGTLAPGAEVDVTAGSANLSAYGTYNFEACTNLSGDENPANNCKTKAVSNNQPSLCTNNLYTTGCTYGDQLKSWNLANINIPNIPCSGTPPWYQNYTNQVHQLNAGQSYTLTVTAGYSNTYFDVWIDFNGDYTLTADELVINDAVCASANVTYTFPFNVPASANNGQFVMRMRTNWLNPVTDPCATYTYGHAVDFGVQIGGGTGAWLSAPVTSGTVPAGQTQQVEIKFNSAGLPSPTVKNGSIIFTHNAQGSPTTVPATLYVGQQPPQGLTVNPSSLSVTHSQPPQTTTHQLTLTNLDPNAITWQAVINTSPTAGPDAVVDPNYVAQQYAQRMAQTPDLAPAEVVKGATVGTTARVEPSNVSYATSNPSRAELWNNGPIITHPTGGAGGNAASAVQTNLGMSTYGFNANHAASPGNYYYFADDFQVTGTWNLETITFYGYQTGSSTTSTFTGVYVRIWNGPPNAGGTVVWGDLTTNRLQSTTWSNIYRVLDTDLTNTQRPVMKIVANVSGCVLNAGTYWLQWGYTGSLTSGPWGPPITILGQTNTGNALQATTTGWTQLIDSGASAPQGLPFIIEGTSGAQPANDVGVTAITAPNSGTNLTNNEQVKIKIKNFGTQAQSNIPWTVNWTGQGTGSLNGTHSGSLAPGAEVEVTCGTANLSAYGTYNFQACTNLQGDENPANNCQTKAVTNSEPTLCVNNLYTTGCTYGDQLTSWNLANINVPNIPCSGTPPWYQNYMNQIHQLQAGQSYTLTVTAGYSNTYFDVWIDFDNNLTLNNNEELVLNDGLCANANTPYTFTINIPANAPSGTFVMRARTNWQNPVTDPCATYTYGQAIDFKAQISGGTPSSWLSVNPTSGSLNPNGTATVTVTINSTGLQPGTYNGSIVFNNTSSVPVVTVPVTLTVVSCPYPAPTNLTVQQTAYNPHKVVLNWTAPVLPGGTIRWDNGTNSDGIGLTAGGTFSVAAKFNPDHLTQYNGLYLNSVDIYPRSQSATYVIKIWKGAAGTQLVHQQNATIVANQWNNIVLTTPVQIDATQALYIGYTVTHTQGEYPAGCDSGPAVANFGDLIQLSGGAWVSMSVQYNLNYNWNIAGNIGLDLMGNPLPEPIQIVPVAPSNTESGIPVKGNLGVLPNAQWTETMRGLEGYNIERNGNVIAQIGLVTTYTDNNVPPGPTTYRVGARYNVAGTTCVSWSSPASINVFVVEMDGVKTLRIYPNPASTFVNVEALKMKEITIVNGIGQIVYSNAVDNDAVQINISGFQKGIYIIRVTTEGQTFTEKLVIR